MMIIQIAGRMGRDAESRFTPSGLKVTTLNVAVNIRKGGKEETVWWRVTIWGDRFSKLLPYLKKGSAIIVVGEMNKPEIWTDKEGRPQVSMEVTAEIIKFSPFNSGSDRPEGSAGANNATSQGSQQSSDRGDMSMDAQDGASQGSYAGYGSTHYGQPSQGEEPLPF